MFVFQAVTEKKPEEKATQKKKTTIDIGAKTYLFSKPTGVPTNSTGILMSVPVANVQVPKIGKVTLAARGRGIIRNVDLGSGNPKRADPGFLVGVGLSWLAVNERGVKGTLKASFDAGKRFNLQGPETVYSLSVSTIFKFPNKMGAIGEFEHSPQLPTMSSLKFSYGFSKNFNLGIGPALIKLPNRPSDLGVTMSIGTGGINWGATFAKDEKNRGIFQFSTSFSL